MKEDKDEFLTSLRFTATCSLLTYDSQPNDILEILNAIMSEVNNVIFFADYPYFSHTIL